MRLESVSVKPREEHHYEDDEQTEDSFWEDQFFAKDWKSGFAAVSRGRSADLGWGRFAMPVHYAIILHCIRTKGLLTLRELLDEGNKLIVARSWQAGAQEEPTPPVVPFTQTSVRQYVTRLVEKGLVVPERSRFAITAKAMAGFAGDTVDKLRPSKNKPKPIIYRVLGLGEVDDEEG